MPIVNDRVMEIVQENIALQNELSRARTTQPAAPESVDSTQPAENLMQTTEKLEAPSYLDDAYNQSDFVPIPEKHVVKRKGDFPYKKGAKIKVSETKPPSPPPPPVAPPPPPPVNEIQLPPYTKLNVGPFRDHRPFPDHRFEPYKRKKTKIVRLAPTKRGVKRKATDVIGNEAKRGKAPIDDDDGDDDDEKPDIKPKIKREPKTEVPHVKRESKIKKKDKTKKKKKKKEKKKKQKKPKVVAVENSLKRKLKETLPDYPDNPSEPYVTGGPAKRRVIRGSGPAAPPGSRIYCRLWKF
ncbi:hypothetical protein CAEBREN_30495 [Caenorhabditis brenneri]|uniref:Uncharacterized protein n=1 Tax=Caenorhabditis brenneri TaxID=135651 RepID=G0MSN1_CAEBE|nr:hypothetical protein CAEBREN_30495 [Caenorhabditis brenneri]